MIVIIDGYNLLKQIFPGSKDNLHKKRSHFIQQLAYYKHNKAEQITELVVVFDAGPHTHASRMVQAGVVVVFSGIKSTADAWILDFVKRHTNDEILVITLDRALREACQQMGADWLGGSEFYTILQNNLLQNAELAFAPTLHESGLEKYEQEDDQESNPRANNQALDLLMEQASMSIESKKDDQGQDVVHKKSKSYTLPKKEKRYQSKIKKLE